MLLFFKNLRSATWIKGVHLIFYVLFLLAIEASLLCPKAQAQCSGIDFKANVTKGCPLLLAKFSATGTSSSAGTTFNWDFGNGFKSGNDTITQSFATSGQYTIKMEATLSGAHSACPVITKDTFITVYPVPHPDFDVTTPSFYCAPAFERFINKTTNAGVASDFKWDFGDGNIASVSDTTDVTHVYHYFNTTQYTISLTALTSHGCVQTIKKTAINIVGPVPMFTIDKHTGCDSLTVHFTNTSKNVKKFNFIYDDGSPIDSVSLASHKYVLHDPSLDSIYFYPTLLSLDDSVCHNYFKDTIKIYRHCTNGISSVDNSQLNFSIYPNPFQSSINVQYSITKTSQINLSLFDITGRQIGTIINEFQVPGDYRFDVNAEKYKLTPGVYMIKLIAGGHVVTRQLVKF